MRAATSRRELWLLDDGRIMGGGQVITLRLARFAERARIVAPGDSELAARAREEGIAVEPVDFPTVPSRRSLRRLRALLRSVEGALVVGASLRAQVYAHTALTGVREKPKIVHFMSEQDSARRAVARIVLRRFGSVVALGGNAADAFRRALGDGATVEEANNILGPEEIAAAVAARQPRGDGPAVLGVLARLIPEKGILELVEELAGAADAWSKLVVGAARQNEAYAQRVERRVSELGLDVELRGQVSDVPAFLGEIDALVVPSVGNRGTADEHHRGARVRSSGNCPPGCLRARLPRASGRPV